MFTVHGARGACSSESRVSAFAAFSAGPSPQPYSILFPNSELRSTRPCRPKAPGWQTLIIANLEIDMALVGKQLFLLTAYQACHSWEDS